MQYKVIKNADKIVKSSPYVVFNAEIQMLADTEDTCFYANDTTFPKK